MLAHAGSREGEDWALAWTDEVLLSERVRTERAGWFGTNEREIFSIDPLSGGNETGATEQNRALILPERPYQVLAERNPPGFAGIRKFVVGRSGKVLSYR